MGTAGPGNFDDDTALDYFDSFTSGILEEIEHAMINPHVLEPDEAEGVVVPCQIDILCALYEKIRPFQLPRPDVVARWKEIYLSVWDGYIDGVQPKPGHKAERRRILEETFTRMEELSRRHKPGWYRD